MILLQGTNYLVPLILIPVLLSRVGLENYGLISLAQSVMFIFVTLCDFGFNLTGTRLLSQNVDDQSYARTLATNIFLIKSVMLLVSFGILVVLVLIIPDWRVDAMLFCSSYLMVVGQAHLPVWYYLGVQKMGTLMLANFFSRIIYIILVLLIIKTPDDFLLVNVLNGGSMVLVTIVALTSLFRTTGIVRFSAINPAELWHFAKSNSPILLSNFIGDSYRSVGMIIAGFLMNSTTLGIYSVFDKVIQLIQNSFSAIYRAIFPKISNLVVNAPADIKLVYRKFYVRFSVPVVISVLGIIFFGGDLMAFASKDLTDALVSPYLYALSTVPFLFYIGLPPSVSLAAYDLKISLLLYHSLCLIIQIILALILIPFAGINGILVSFAVSQIVPTIYAFLVLSKKDVELF